MIENKKQLLSVQSIDAALQEWRQGDFVLGEQWFIYRIDPKKTLAESSPLSESEEADLVEVETKGLIVVTQTCDIVRSCELRPFVQVVPLVEVPENMLKEIQRCRRPQYAFIPGAKDHCLVADLDRVMTVEKPVVSG